MKKLLALFLLTTFLSCGALNYIPDNYGVVKGWGYKEMPPSQVTTSGATFYSVKLSTKSYSVGGMIDDPDSTFYYEALMQDFGWTRQGDEFEGLYTTTPKRGHLYFDLKRGVAVYFYPKTSFNVFKVTLDTTED